MVLPKYKVVILINGCFWDGHDCHIAKRPNIRSEYWSEKIQKNMERDGRNKKYLHELGWRIAIIWEYAIFGKTKILLDTIGYVISAWLKSNEQEITVECSKIGGDG